MNRKTSFFKNPCVWYLGAWCLYLMQGTLYTSGATLSQFLLFIIIAWSAINAVRVIKMNNTPLYFKGLNVLIVMYTIYGLFLFVTDGTMVEGKSQSMPSLYYLKGYYMALLPIYSCYLFARKGLLNSRVVSIFALIFIIVGILDFYRTQREMLEKLMDIGSQVTEITNNSGYVMLSVIPSLLIFNKKPIVQYVGIGVCVVFIFLAMKRGAILCLGAFLFLFALHKMETTRGSRRLLVISTIIVAFVLLFGFVENLSESSDYFQARIEQTRSGDNSNRSMLYQGFWRQFIYDSSLFNQLFGYGAYGTIKVGESFAHNDWLETLTNQGLMGVSFLILYCVYFFKTSRIKRYNRESRFALLVIFIFFFLQTFFSAGITNTTIFTSCMTGFALADGFSET